MFDDLNDYNIILYYVGFKAFRFVVGGPLLCFIQLTRRRNRKFQSEGLGLK